MTVTPVADPCVGNLATPVNSSYFTRAFLNALPAYRPSLSPNRRGLEVGMAHGFFLYGPFAITGPLRHTEFASTAGLLATIGLVSILTVCLSIYGTAGQGEFASGFWLGGCGGAAFAWFLCSTALVAPLVKIAGGVWSVG